MAEEFVLEFRAGVIKGLRNVIGNPRNQQAFVELQGMYPEEGILRSVKEFDILDLSSLNCTFPYPQVWGLSKVKIVATADSIYEYRDGVLTLKLSYLTQGEPWSVADFGEFILLTNNVVTVVRDVQSGEYAVNTNPDIPVGSCVCNLNGQAIWGQPNTIRR